ncbi:MAG: SDR family oxidoreductase [Alphaproteobacteria bacterium]|nr:SDR family oxidoreductase [Alphaproteobacteria bacterium]
MNRLFCFGLGYSAQALARRLSPKGWRVAGTARAHDKVNALTARGVEAFTFPLANPPEALEGMTHALVSTPPAADGDPAFAYADALAALHPQWLAYLSTTGVYGDHAGAWVDETTLQAPASDRGRRRVAAEQAWLAWGAKANVPVLIFRLAGIYGPGRNQLESLRDGTARRIVREAQVFSRIHVDDIAQVLEASIERPQAGAIYNVCDDEPAPPHEVIEYAAHLLGMPPPPLERFEDAVATMSEMAQSFYMESKRVRNARIKQELGVKLLYPTYREGLKALLPGTAGF